MSLLNTSPHKQTYILNKIFKAWSPDQSLVQWKIWITLTVSYAILSTSVFTLHHYYIVTLSISLLSICIIHEINYLRLLDSKVLYNKISYYWFESMFILLISLSLVIHIADPQKFNLFILISLNAGSHFSLLKVKFLLMKHCSFGRVDLLGSSTSEQSKHILIWKPLCWLSHHWNKYGTL